MKKLLTLLALPFLLAACTDTTGLSAESSREPKGNPNSSVVVMEFADLQCPACRAAHTTVVQPLLTKYGNRIRYELRHFPLQSAHRFALDLAEAAECSADQGKFWEFVDLAFVNQPSIKKGSIEEWAGSLGIDMDLFNRCTASNIKRDGIMEEYDQGREIGVTGTPTFFVNGKRVTSTVEELSVAIDAALSSAGSRL